MALTSSNLNRFSQVFHRWKECWICSKIIPAKPVDFGTRCTFGKQAVNRNLTLSIGLYHSMHLGSFPIWIFHVNRIGIELAVRSVQLSRSNASVAKTVHKLQNFLAFVERPYNFISAHGNLSKLLNLFERMGALIIQVYFCVFVTSYSCYSNENLSNLSKNRPMFVVWKQRAAAASVATIAAVYTDRVGARTSTVTFFVTRRFLRVLGLGTAG